MGASLDKKSAGFVYDPKKVKDEFKRVLNAFE